MIKHIKTDSVAPSSSALSGPLVDRTPWIASILLLASGAASLIYEVVWLHLLRLSIGVSSYSLGILLATYMGGMALGSLLYAKVAPPGRRPFKAYAVLEWGIAAYGLAMPWLLPQIVGLYEAGVGWYGSSIAMRAIVASLVLLPPTILMGATLPAISRSLAGPSSATWIGRFYGANLVGAVTGSLFAGIVLLQYFDTTIASLSAAAINLAVGLIAWFTGGVVHREVQSPPCNPASATLAKDARPSGPRIAAAICLFFSGAAALGAEVVWTRLLTLSFGPTVYSFALVLAVYLAGLGLGAFAASAVLNRVRRPLAALCICQMLLILTIAWASTGFSDASLAWRSPWMLPWIASWPGAFRDLIRCVVTIVPSAMLWGASFPLAVRSALGPQSDPARVVGELSAANTLGAILGALATAFLIVPNWGTQTSQYFMLFATTLAAASCVVGQLGRLPRTAAVTMRPGLPWFAPACLLLTIGLTVYAYGQISPPAPALFAYGREAAKRRGDAPMLVVREGVHSPIVVTHWPNHHDVTALHLDGKLVASDDKIDLRVERMLGHIPQLIVDRPRSVLVVGLGAGITAGAFAIDPRTEQITICELEPALPPITAKFFGEANHHVLNDPRTTLILNDARHYLRTSGRQFDVIAVDPIHPWVHGAAALYSLEFFSHCRDHVSAGGVVSFWVPLHSMSTAAVQCELATFFQVFPHATVWHTGGTTLQRHLMMIGSREAQVIDFARVDRLTSPGEPFDRSLQEMGFAAPDEMLALFLGDDQSLSGWLSGVPLNRDRNLRLEYLAGAAAYRNERQKVFAKVARFRTWPKKLFRGDFARQEAIRLRLPAADHIEGDEEAKTWRHRRPRTPPGLRDRIASHLSPLPLS